MMRGERVRGAATPAVRNDGMGAAAIRALAARYGIRPSKTLGQNFLVDPNLARAIAADAGAAPGISVVEVGAGLGSLTLALAATGARVLAIEFDRALLPALEEVVGGLPNVVTRRDDAMKLDWPSVLGGGAWVLCANLPFNVATPLVLDVLRDVPAIERLVVIVQREVAERLVARPGDHAYGAVSVRVAYRARARLVRAVPPEVFWPRPGVGSAVVGIERLSSPPVQVPQARLWRVVDEAFSQRRKTIRNALRRLGLDAMAADALLKECAIDPAARPEELGLTQLARLAEGLP
jgi:16S rRNA (adenine1518-N6/adenine1519-N6)-dimethyltransferase